VIDMIEAILGGIFYLVLVFIGVILLKTIRKMKKHEHN